MVSMGAVTTCALAPLDRPIESAQTIPDTQATRRDDLHMVSPGCIRLSPVAPVTAR